MNKRNHCETWRCSYCQEDASKVGDEKGMKSVKRSLGWWWIGPAGGFWYYCNKCKGHQRAFFGVEMDQGQ